MPTVSIIVPCRNEQQHIAGCLESILASRYPASDLDVWVVDGMSDDRTREIVGEFADRSGRIHLLDNPDQTTPCGLNVGILASHGAIVLRMDAHVTYPSDYVPRLVEGLLESGADNVGGTIVTVPASDSPVAHAIALGLSHRFGVGNAYFRIGCDHVREVDTVPFGCYRREVFSRIGLFDEELVRNQDDEFNLRLIKRGGRILLLPHIVSFYSARSSIRQLARMYWQYGYFKPLVLRKVGGIMTGRALVPSTLVLALGATGALSPWSMTATLMFFATLGAYLTLVLGASIVAGRARGPRCVLALVAVFPVLHFSYGLGFLAGLADQFGRARRTHRPRAAVPLSR